MFQRVMLYSVLIVSVFLFAGCAGKSADKPKEAAEPVTAAEKTTQTPCDAVIAEAASEARTTMKIVTKSCQDNTIEATPVWGLNYKGAVHVRVYDKDGAQIDDTYLQP